MSSTDRLGGDGSQRRLEIGRAARRRPHGVPAWTRTQVTHGNGSVWRGVAIQLVGGFICKTLKHFSRRSPITQAVRVYLNTLIVALVYNQSWVAACRVWRDPLPGRVMTVVMKRRACICGPCDGWAWGTQVRSCPMGSLGRAPGLTCRYGVDGGMLLRPKIHPRRWPFTGGRGKTEPIRARAPATRHPGHRSRMGQCSSK